MPLPPARLLPALALVLGLLAPVGAQEWRWPARFNPASSPELVSTFSKLHATHALGPGVAVEDVRFRADSFELHLLRGVVFPEPPVEGRVVGAWFEGEATVTFAPEPRKSRDELADYFGTETLEAEPVRGAYLFSLRSEPLLEQLAATGEPTTPLEDSSAYQEAKAALRMRGTRVLHAFLNRDGRSEGTMFALFAPPRIRNSPGASGAHLLYSYDPGVQSEVGLSVFGHPWAFNNPHLRNLLQRYPVYKFLFWTVTELRSRSTAFQPHGRVAEYATELSIGRGMRGTDARTKVVLTPGEGVSALMFDLTARLQVREVLDPEGRALPFVQWDLLADQPNHDQKLVVWTREPLEPRRSFPITVVSGGPLFEAALGAYYLADEDRWYPRLDDPESSIYDLTCEIPRNMTAVSAGSVVSEDSSSSGKTVRFRTSRPQSGSSFYYGQFETHKATADDTQVVMLATTIRDYIRSATALPGYDAPDVMTLENPRKAATEIANAVKVYNRILGHPLELETLRVVTTPTRHGRGFEGLLLLSVMAASSADSSRADLFRAHEVAHQWWGNMVQSKYWPEDRWLGESFAEYSAMEFYDLRYQKPDRTRALMKEAWVDPLFKVAAEPIQTLTGEGRRVRSSEVQRIIDGGQNVYTKGPLVLHHLRYLFAVQKKGDEGFWTMLQDFLGAYKYQRVSTEDFKRHVERHLGGRMDWFWNQWLHDSRLPTVRWSHGVTRAEGGGWRLTVTGEQEDTEFVMPVPVYLTLSDGRTVTIPLVFKGKQAQAQLKLRERPAKVSLNDNYEAPIRVR
jgi:hypothetical protein